MRNAALTALWKLVTAGSISPPGLEAMDEGLPLHETLAKAMQGQVRANFLKSPDTLANHHVTWRHARWLEALERDPPPAEQRRHAYQKESLQLRKRAPFLEPSRS